MTQRLWAEGIGTGMLLVSVVGSGIMAQTLTEDIALALLANAIATGCMLFVLITVLGPISGAHFNPAVTLAFYLRREIDAVSAGKYVGVQIIGAVLGVWLTHFMFAQSILQVSATDRTGPAQWGSEVFATFGLLFVIFGGLRSRPEAVPTLVALYITGAYWFTSSTSFANPAVSIARAFSDTFAGINPAQVLIFTSAQIVAVFLAAAVLPRLFRA